MKRHLTKIDEPMTILSAGETDSGSAEVQPARDSQAKATNCRWDGGLNSAVPFIRQSILSLLMPQKTSCRRQVYKL